jgi:hypothetical protein
MQKKKSVLSYLVFGLLLFVVLYAISTQKFGEVNFEPRNSPLGDILLFLATFSVSIISSFIQGETIGITLPFYLGRTIIILIPIWMGLSFITGTPIAITLVAGVAWICKDMNIDTLVLKTFILSLVTLILFASLGMLISVLKKEEEGAVHLGNRIIKFFQLLLVLWLISTHHARYSQPLPCEHLLGGDDHSNRGIYGSFRTGSIYI